MPDDTLYQGTATDYAATHPTPPPDAPAEGGLFGETLGAKIARGLLYVVPIAGQIVAGQERKVASQRAAVNQLILQGALKSQDPELLQSPEVQKAAKGMFGAHGNTFLGIATHVAQHHRDIHNGWIGLMLKHGYGQPGRNPADVMRDAAAEAVHNGMPIPQEAQSLISQHVLKPVIAAATEAGVRPEKVETQRQKTQAGIDVQTDPTNVGAKAAAGAYVARERQQAVEEVKLPYQLGREQRADVRAQAREQRQEGRARSKEERAQQEQVTKEDRRILTAGEVAKLEATDADNHPVQLVPDQSTVGDLRNLVANGGNVRAKETGLLATLGFQSRPTQRLKHVTGAPAKKLTPAEEADAYFHGGQ